MKVVVGCDVAHYTRSIGQFDNRMSYAVCLRELGHDVVLLADVYPERCLDDDHRRVGFDEFAGRREFDALAAAYGDFDYCLVYDGGRATHGMTFERAVAEAESADVLVNIGGKLQTPELVDRIPCRIFVDLAPAKTQAYVAEYEFDLGLERHHLFFTVGLNVGTPGCVVPDCGVQWRGWMHPVPLSLWPAHVDAGAARYSTITGWAGKETFVLAGRYSGEKSGHWHELAGVPRRSGKDMEIAVRLPAGYEGDGDMLRDNGWRVTDPRTLDDLGAYQRFVRGSRGEFTVANQRYTEYRTGWFSERSARYLASGKPVIMQSTGFEDHVPAGKGFLTYRTMDEAVAAIAAVEDDYLSHCDAARSLAEERMDGARLLAEMLAVAGR